MDISYDIATTIVAQMQKPTLAFLIGGMMIAALGSKLEVPEPVYKFIVILLLLKVGIGAGISVREANFVELVVPALLAAGVGIAFVLLGRLTLARLKGVSQMDGMATAGLFGAVSASTLAAGMAMLGDAGVAYEGFIGALYPFMDVAALVSACVLGRLAAARKAAKRCSRMARASSESPAASRTTSKVPSTPPWAAAVWRMASRNSLASRRDESASNESMGASAISGTSGISGAEIISRCPPLRSSRTAKRRVSRPAARAGSTTRTPVASG